MGYDTSFADLLQHATLRWAARAEGGDPTAQQMDDLLNARPSAAPSNHDIDSGPH